MARRERGESRRSGKKQYDSVILGGMNGGKGKQLYYGFFNVDKLLDAIEEANEKTGDGKRVSISIIDAGEYSDVMVVCQGAEERDDEGGRGDRRGGGRRERSSGGSSSKRSSAPKRRSREEEEDDDESDDDEDDEEDDKPVAKKKKKRHKPADDEDWEDEVPF